MLQNNVQRIVKHIFENEIFTKSCIIQEDVPVAYGGGEQQPPAQQATEQTEQQDPNKVEGDELLQQDPIKAQLDQIVEKRFEKYTDVKDDLENRIFNKR